MFDLPPDVINPDISSILRFGALCFAGALMIIPIINMWIENVMNKEYPKSRVGQFLWAYAPVLMLLGLYFLNYGSYWRRGALIFGLLTGLLACDLILGFRGHPLGGAKLVIRLITGPGSLFDTIRDKIGTVACGVLIIFIFGGAISHMVGQGEAIRQVKFSVPASRTNAVVVRAYGDTAVCVPIGTNKQPVKLYFLLNAKDETNGFMRMAVGRLTFSKY